MSCYRSLKRDRVVDKLADMYGEDSAYSETVRSDL